MKTTLDSSLSTSTSSSTSSPFKGDRGGLSSSSRENSSPFKGDREGLPSPWGYVYMPHYAAQKFEDTLQTTKIEGDFKPNCFIHRTAIYKRTAGGKKELIDQRPTISGLVFLQGETKDLMSFLQKNFPQYHLAKDCSTGRPATIKHSVMVPFMRVLETKPERVTLLSEPFRTFAKDHVKLRVKTGILTGMEGYVVRIKGDRQLVMDFGGASVAISNVHNEDFEVVE